MLKQISPRQLIILSGTVLALLMIYLVAISIAHIGKTKLSIRVIPSDAKVTINSQKASSKTAYLTPGKYTVTASKQGWKTDSQTLNVSNEATNINLLPAPNSSEANKLLKDNPKLQLEREKLGGENVAAGSARALQQNPIIGLLPYTSITGPFSIDYGSSPTRKDGIAIIISNSSPNGRQKALAWIRDHGQNPTDLEIIYSNFANPLVPYGEDN